MLCDDIDAICSGPGATWHLRRGRVKERKSRRMNFLVSQGNLEAISPYAVLRSIEAHVFGLRTDAKAHCVLDAQKHDGRGADRPREDGKGSDNLHAELLSGLASGVCVGVRGVLHVGVDAEDANRPQAPRPADAVNHRCVARVVDPQLLEKEAAEVEQQPGDSADNEGMPGLNQLAAGGDGDKAGKDAVESHRNAEVSQNILAQEGDYHTRDRARQGGIDNDLACNVGQVAAQAEGGAGVEAVPAKPEDHGAERLESLIAAVKLVNLSVRVKAASAGTDDDCTDKTGESANHVHHTAARKVDDAVGVRGLAEDGPGLAVSVGVSTPR